MTTTTIKHPLEMLTGDEIKRAVKLLRASDKVPEGSLFASVVLHEPEKADLARWKPGDPVERRVRAVIVPGPGNHVIEGIVRVDTGQIESLTDVHDVRPTLLMTEAGQAI